MYLTVTKLSSMLNITHYNNYIENICLFVGHREIGLLQTEASYNLNVRSKRISWRTLDDVLQTVIKTGLINDIMVE